LYNAKLDSKAVVATFGKDLSMLDIARNLYANVLGLSNNLSLDFLPKMSFQPKRFKKKIVNLEEKFEDTKG